MTTTEMALVPPTVADLKPSPETLLSAARHVAEHGIQNQPQADACGAALGMVTQLEKTITEAYEPSVKSAHEAHKRILALRNSHMDVLKEAKKLISTALGQWVKSLKEQGIAIAGDVRAVETVKFIVEDLSLVPREFLILDEKRVKAEVSAHGLDTNIPGIKVYAETSARRKPGRPRKEGAA